MSTAIGCLLHLVAIAAATFWLDRTFGASVDPLLRPWAALLASVLLVLGVSNVVHLLRGYGQGDGSRRAILSRAATGEPPVEGGPMVVTGVARPEQGAPLEAPLSGTACVAYEYRIYQRERFATGRQRRMTVIWMGVAMQPFFVDTGGRSIRVLGCPDVADARRNLSKQPGPVGRARDLVSRQPFEEFSGAGIASVFSALTALRTSTQPRGYRHDWHREGWTRDPGSLRMDETVVPVGTTISVAGHWSPQHQAIVPEPGGLAGSPVTAAVGDAAALAGRATALPSSAIAVAIFGVLLLAAGGVLVWAMNAGLVRVPAM